MLSSAPKNLIRFRARRRTKQSRCESLKRSSIKKNLKSLRRYIRPSSSITAFVEMFRYRWTRPLRVSEIKAFPDIHMTVELAAAQGDFVTVVWRFHGTHTAFGYGLPPTGTRIEIRGITVWRIVDGKIRDEWSSFNELTGYMQVLRHLRWFLLGLLLGLTLLVWKVPKLIRNFRRRNETGQLDSGN